MGDIDSLRIKMLSITLGGETKLNAQSIPE